MSVLGQGQYNPAVETALAQLQDAHFRLAAAVNTDLEESFRKIFIRTFSQTVSVLQFEKPSINGNRVFGVPDYRSYLLDVVHTYDGDRGTAARLLLEA
jgi:hypothetical protein